MTTTSNSTIEAIVSSGAAVQRDGMMPGGSWGAWTEQLSVPGWATVAAVVISERKRPQVAA